ncbi:MAG: methionine synthase [Oscillospiraceae bacterium]|nr:methionine synthase [Oscillospiraceae bacterium]
MDEKVTSGYLEDALRYLGVRGEPPRELRAQAEDIAAEIAEEITPKYTFRAFPLARTPEGVSLEGSGVVLPGALAGKMLADCDAAVLLACTLGALFERKLRALEKRDMSAAVICDACGSAWVEQGCDMAEREIRARFPGRYLTDRFSPGYGDLPFSLQPDILSALDAARRLGVVAGESLMMTPSKSVTAIIGVSGEPQRARVRGCAFCALRDGCKYRREGQSCEV